LQAPFYDKNEFNAELNPNFICMNFQTMGLKWRDAVVRAIMGTAGGYLCSIFFMSSLVILLYGFGLVNRGEATIYAGIAALLVWLLLILLAFVLASVRHLLILMLSILMPSILIVLISKNL
jgi:hypothetical protein